MIRNGLLTTARQFNCSHFNSRPDEGDISLLVIHNISLPPGQFDNNFVEAFFCGTLDPGIAPYFEKIASLRVSSHLYIKRDGSLLQFVPFHKRAWHAGVSTFEGRQNCNDFSIGIELQGTDDTSYTAAQYQQLISVTRVILAEYPKINRNRIVGHSDIAPDRKSDPGESFEWSKYLDSLA